MRSYAYSRRYRCVIQYTVYRGYLGVYAAWCRYAKYLSCPYGMLDAAAAGSGLKGGMASVGSGDRHKKPL